MVIFLVEILIIIQHIVPFGNFNGKQSLLKSFWFVGLFGTPFQTFFWIKSSFLRILSIYYFLWSDIQMEFYVMLLFTQNQLFFVILRIFFVILTFMLLKSFIMLQKQIECKMNFFRYLFIEDRRTLFSFVNLMLVKYTSNKMRFL